MCDTRIRVSFRGLILGLSKDDHSNPSAFLPLMLPVAMLPVAECPDALFCSIVCLFAVYLHQSSHHANIIKAYLS